MGLAGFQRRRRELAKKKAKKETKKEKGISDYNAKDAIKAVSDCDNLEQINTWLEEEKQGKNRSTVIEPLETKQKELEEPGDD